MLLFAGGMPPKRFFDPAVSGKVGAIVRHNDYCTVSSKARFNRFPDSNAGRKAVLFSMIDMTLLTLAPESSAFSGCFQWPSHHFHQSRKSLGISVAFFHSKDNA